MTRFGALFPLSARASVAWGFAIGLGTSLAGGAVYLRSGSVGLAAVVGVLVLVSSELVLALGLGTLRPRARR